MPSVLRTILTFIFSLHLTLSATEEGTLSHEALFGPNKIYPYFDSHSQLHAESPHEFSANNAAMLAQCSMLAYVREHEFIAEQFSKIGYDSTEFFDVQGTFAYLAENQDHIVVCFRGTESADKIDYLTDARFLQKNFTPHGRAHSGFIDALDLVETQILAALESRAKTTPSKTVWFTGHSMGAALATLFSIKYPEKVDALYAIGSPRLANRKLARHWHETLNIFRIVNNNDLVTRVPTPPFYQHIGATHFLTAEGDLIVDPPVTQKWKDRLKGHGKFAQKLIEEHWSDGDFSAIPSDYFVDHSPLMYTQILSELAAR